MLFLKTRGFVLGLVMVLLWPAAAFAQEPDASPGATPPLGRLKVDFVTVGAADLDADLNKLDLTLDRVPFAQPEEKPFQAQKSLRYVTGDAAVRLFQMLAHARSSSVQAPPIITNSGVLATVQVNTLVPNRHKSLQTLQNGLIITPRINTDDSITLYVGLKIADADTPPTGPQETTLRTIRSGDMMVVDGLPLGGDKTAATEKLLVFIQPTLVGADAQKADAGQPASIAPPVPGRSDASTERSFLDVSNADLQAVVAVLRQQTGVRILVLGAAGAYKPIDVHLVAVPLATALQAIAASAGAQVSRNGEGVYVFSPVPGAALAAKP